jgi:hypothetical protein
MDFLEITECYVFMIQPRETYEVDLDSLID